MATGGYATFIVAGCKFKLQIKFQLVSLERTDAAVELHRFVTLYGLRAVQRCAIPD
jgi:hypothetical protein